MAVAYRKVSISERGRTVQKQVSVNEWVNMFKEIGLDEKTMMKWHHLFESRHPEAHQSFLEWLGLSPETIEEIRQKSR